MVAAWVTWSLPLTACTHQVEVGEDAGGPVLLGHEQQHLVVNKVTVLLERASQTQLQGLADLWVWCKGESPGPHAYEASEDGTLSHLHRAKVGDWGMPQSWRRAK